MDKVREEVLAKWTPDKVEEVCGVPEAQVTLVLRTNGYNLSRALDALKVSMRAPAMPAAGALSLAAAAGQSALAPPPPALKSRTGAPVPR
jgi:anaerobic selenocysteine-containing dehydrogenase